MNVPTEPSGEKRPVNDVEETMTVGRLSTKLKCEEPELRQSSSAGSVRAEASPTQGLEAGTLQKG